MTAEERASNAAKAALKKTTEAKKKEGGIDSAKSEILSRKGKADKKKKKELAKDYDL